MPNPDFIVHMRFPDTVQFTATEWFDTAIEQVKWHQQKNLSTPNDVIRIASERVYEQTLSVLGYARETANLTKFDDGVELAFALKHIRSDFDEISEDGRRMWLRQHLDDHINHYIPTSYNMRAMDILGDSGKMTAEVERCNQMADLWHDALSQAYEKESPTFRIEHE